MQLSDNTVLITGGATGIGYAIILGVSSSSGLCSKSSHLQMQNNLWRNRSPRKPSEDFLHDCFVRRLNNPCIDQRRCAKWKT